jgi:hypothetical protein
VDVPVRPVLRAEVLRPVMDLAGDFFEADPDPEREWDFDADFDADREEDFALDLAADFESDREEDFEPEPAELPREPPPLARAFWG